MYKKAIIAGAAIALAISAGIVRAQSVDGAWYGGIDLGRSRLGLGGGDFDNALDRKSTRLNSSHGYISYAVFCLKKKKKMEWQKFHIANSVQPGTSTQQSLVHVDDVS